MEKESWRVLLEVSNMGESLQLWVPLGQGKQRSYPVFQAKYQRGLFSEKFSLMENLIQYQNIKKLWDSSPKR